MAALRIGTCSWKYDSCAGLVYSDEAKSNYLNVNNHYEGSAPLTIERIKSRPG